MISNNIDNMNELITQKLNNFKLFCCSTFPDNELIKQQAEELSKAPVELFVIYVKTNLVQYKSNLSDFITKMTEQYKIDYQSLPEADKTKFSKYFQFFIESVEQL